MWSDFRGIQIFEWSKNPEKCVKNMFAVSLVADAPGFSFGSILAMEVARHEVPVWFGGMNDYDHDGHPDE